jgi:uncharacterized protein
LSGCWHAPASPAEGDAVANLIRRRGVDYADEPILARARRGLPLDVPVIDAHGHLGAFAPFYIPRIDSASMVALMDRCGVRAIAVSAHRGLDSDPFQGNREIAEAAEEFPGRFIGYATANPHYPTDETEADLEHWLAQSPWVRGVKLHPSLHNYPVTGPRYRIAFEVAARHNVPVLSHSWGEGEEALLCSPTLLGQMAEAYPTVPILIGHSGGILTGYRLSIEVARRHPNVYLETCGSFQAMGLMEFLVDEVGPERVLFGSDMAFLSLTAALGRAVYAKLTTTEKRMILGANAARLFRYPIEEAATA